MTNLIQQELPDMPEIERTYESVIVSADFYKKWFPDLDWNELPLEVREVLHAARLYGASAGIRVLIEQYCNKEV